MSISFVSYGPISVLRWLRWRSASSVTLDDVLPTLSGLALSPAKRWSPSTSRASRRPSWTGALQGRSAAAGVHRHQQRRCGRVRSHGPPLPPLADRHPDWPWPARSAQQGPARQTSTQPFLMIPCVCRECCNCLMEDLRDAVSSLGHGSRERSEPVAP
jgi:hypothetical protein